MALMESAPSMKRYSKLNPKRAFGVTRASTTEQKTSHVAQRDAIHRWCLVNGVELVEVFEDAGVSGSAPIEEREGLLRALSTMRAQDVGVLVFAKPDRFFRDTLAAMTVERDLERLGARLVYADGTSNDKDPTAKFTRTIMLAAAEMERHLIRGRIKAAITAKKERGETYCGNPPYGWMNDENGVMVENPQEQAVISRIFELRNKKFTERLIAFQLEKEGLLSRAGVPFHKTQVHRILKKGRD